MSFGADVKGLSEKAKGYADGLLAIGAPAQVQEVGIGGFRLFARVSEQPQWTAQAPTSPLEDGAQVTDHVIVDPHAITIQGTVADIYLEPRPEDVVSRYSAKVGMVSSFLPERQQAQLAQATMLATTARDAVRRVSDLIEAGTNAVDMFGDKTPSTPLRQQFLDFIEATFKGRAPITISTKYRDNKQMILLSLSITRGNTEDADQFSLTAQQVEFASLRYADISEFWKAPAPAVKKQVEKKKDAGTTDTAAEAAKQVSEQKSALYSFAEALRGGTLP